MEQILTFEKLPEAVSQLYKKIENVERLILQNAENKTADTAEKFLTIKEAAELLHLAVPTLYSKVSRRELPCFKRGKRLYFSRQSLIQFLKEGKIKTKDEITASAGAFIKKKGGKS